jgi:hypothetical protein
LSSLRTGVLSLLMQGVGVSLITSRKLWKLAFNFTSTCLFLS